MTREKVLIGLGALVLVSPWSGLPLAWLAWGLTLIGLAVIGISFTLSARSRPTQSNEPPVERIVEPAPSRTVFS